MSYSLLPPNSSLFERRAEEATRFDALNEAIDAIAGVKADMPESFAAWLAAEWFLADFSGYFPTSSALIAAGLPWLRMRGTAAAVRRALGWIGFEADIEEDGARLHLDPGSPAAPERLADVRHLVRRSIPAHVLFYRLFHGYDIRHLRLDRSRLDDALLDDDSGVLVDGLKLSFGTRAAHTFEEPDAQAITAGYSTLYSVLIWDDDGWRLDAWRLDSDVNIDAASGGVSQTVIVLPEPDDGEAPMLGRSDVISLFIDPGPDDAPMRARDDAFAIVLPDTGGRRWSGPWSGPWRETIPHTLTQLES